VLAKLACILLSKYFNQDLRKRGFNPLSLRERVRVRGLKKVFFFIDPLIPTFSRREKEQNA
jgi:hypothetical protein